MARRVLMASTRETEVRLVRWCEGGLEQQRNDGRGWVTMRERSERVESPGTYVIGWVSRCHFCLALCSFGKPSRALVVIYLERGGMPLHDAVGINCKSGQLQNTKAQMSSIWAKVCMLMTVCVIGLDMTTPHWWREKVMVYYYYLRSVGLSIIASGM